MKKLAKLLALGLAAALTFGMTVSAAESPNTDSSNAESEALNDSMKDFTIDSSGWGQMLWKPITAGELESAKAELKDNEVILAAREFTVRNNVPVTMSFYVDGVSADKEYVVLHGLADGSWERLVPTIFDNGALQVTFNSLSPVVIVEVLEKDNDDNDDEDDDEEDDDDTTEVSGVVTSPKTGAGLPVAGVMAVICLAGAAVSTKKARN